MNCETKIPRIFATTHYFENVSQGAISSYSELLINDHYSGKFHYMISNRILYEVCLKNTRTEVIKNVRYLEVTCLNPLQSTFLPNAYTYPNGVFTS